MTHHRDPTTADSADVTYVAMGPGHTEQAAGLCAAEGWNVDADLVHQYYLDYPGGTFVALHQGQVVGYCSASVLNEDHAFICFFVVKEQFRRSGIGGRLLSATVQALGDRNVCLFAVPHSVSYYKAKGGFKGSDPPVLVCASIFAPQIPDTDDPAPDVSIRTIHPEDLDSLIKYDKTIHIIERRKILQTCVTAKDYGVLAKGSNGHICGYSFVDKKPKAAKVMPLYADNTSIAKKLLRHVVRKLPKDEKIQVFFPEKIAKVVKFQKDIGFSYDNCCKLEFLWTKERFEVPIEKVYSLMNASNVFT